MVWKSSGIVLHSMGDRILTCLVLAILNISPGCKGSKEHLGALVNENRLMTLPVLTAFRVQLHLSTLVVHTC